MHLVYIMQETLILLVFKGRRIVYKCNTETLRR